MPRKSEIRRLLVLTGSLLLLLSAFADSNLTYTLQRARQLQEKREYAASAKLLDHYIDRYQSQQQHLSRQDSTDLIKLLRTQGENFYNIGVTSKAADLFEQALKIADATGDRESTAAMCNELFIIHFNSGNTALSRDLLARSLQLYRALHDTGGTCKILNNLGILHYNLSEYDQSIRYYNESLQISETDTLLRRTLRPTILSNLAQTYNAMGDYGNAIRSLDKAIDLLEEDMTSPAAIQAQLNKASALTHMGRLDEARKIVNRVSGSKIESADPYVLASTFNQISAVHLALGDSVAGLRWHLRASDMEDSLHTKEENEQLRQILIRYNSERIADHNKILELDVRRQRMINYVMVGLIIVAAVLTIFLIYKIRSDRRKNRLIRTQREQLLEFERKEHERKERAFQQQLDHKNRQLTSYSIDAASISELHKILLDSLKRISSDASPASRQEINDCIAHLKNFNRTEVNEDFRVYFNEVHPDLLKKISLKYPALTPNDLRLCSYLYLGMSTKEIAALTFREIRSVESSRLRLRKKLGITGDQTLHDFLHSI